MGYNTRFDVELKGGIPFVNAQHDLIEALRERRALSKVKTTPSRGSSSSPPRATSSSRSRATTTRPRHSRSASQNWTRRFVQVNAILAEEKP
jgi:hypothetical protein